MGFTGEELEFHVKAVEIVGAEGSLEDMPNLLVVASGFEFLGGATDGKVVDEDLALLESALGDAAEFTQLEVAEALDANPDADSKHSENQAEGTAGWPKQKQAEQREHGRDTVENNHDLAMSEAVLQQFVMDMFTIGSEHRAAADQTPEDGK